MTLTEKELRNLIWILKKETDQMSYFKNKKGGLYFKDRVKENEILLNKLCKIYYEEPRDNQHQIKKRRK